jgi:hypothetical protein
VAHEVARLRHAAHDRRLDRIAERIGRAHVVGRRVAEERLHVTERGCPDAEHVRIDDRVLQLIELGRIEAVLQADADRQRRHGQRRVEGGAGAGAAVLPVGRRNDAAVRAVERHVAVDRLLGVDAQHVACVRRIRREVRDRVAHHVERRRDLTAAVDDAADESARDVGQHRHLDVVVREGARAARGQTGRIGRRQRRPAGVVALPGAQQLHVHRRERVGRKADVAAAVGNVVPHDAARGRHVLGLAQYEARDVGDLARRVARERVGDVGDERVVRVGGIDLAEGPTGQLLVRRLVVDGGRRVDHDARDARLHRRRRRDAGENRSYRAQPPTGAAQPQLTHGCLL